MIRPACHPFIDAVSTFFLCFTRTIKYLVHCLWTENKFARHAFSPFILLRNTHWELKNMSSSKVCTWYVYLVHQKIGDVLRTWWPHYVLKTGRKSNTAITYCPQTWVTANLKTHQKLLCYFCNYFTFGKANMKVKATFWANRKHWSHWLVCTIWSNYICTSKKCGQHQSVNAGYNDDNDDIKSIWTYFL